jgi:glycoprotein endo-alpha-1,2-mannosidase
MNESVHEWMDGRKRLTYFVVVDGIIYRSWWGPDRTEDTTTRTVILPHADLQDMKVALLYESTGRIREEFNDTSFASNVEPDILHMCENYFDHPNYLRFNGRPVLFVYLTRLLSSQAKLEQVILTMRSTADTCGHSIYIVGDHAFHNSPDPSLVNLEFLYLDAVTNYDVYGSLKSDRLWNSTVTRYAGPEAVDSYYQEQDLWKSRAWQYECNYIPSVSPGFNDRGVRLEADHHPLARELTENSEQGTLFAYGIALAKALVDPGSNNLMLVNSFNEWHEDTQIEPTISTSGDANGGATQFPIILTEGVEYAAYGELYLDILREGTIGRGNIFNAVG